MESDSFARNLEWFKANQRKLANLYEGLFLVIKDCAVVATFHDFFEAYRWKSRHFTDNSTAIYQAKNGKAVYTITTY